MGVYEELVERGLIAQITDEEHIRELVNNVKCSILYRLTQLPIHFMTATLWHLHL